MIAFPSMSRVWDVLHPLSRATPCVVANARLMSWSEVDHRAELHVQLWIGMGLAVVLRNLFSQKHEQTFSSFTSRTADGIV